MGLIPRPQILDTSTALSRRRKAVALLVAGLTDLLQLVFFPMFFAGAASPFDWVLDLLTALVLTGIVGFKWRTLLGIVVELVPGLDLFPTWTALVLSFPSAPKEPRAGEGGPPALPGGPEG